MKKNHWKLFLRRKTGINKISLLMAFTLAFSILPIGAFAEEGTTEPVTEIPPVVIPPVFPPMPIVPGPIVTPEVTNIEVNGENNAQNVIVGTDLQMEQDSDQTVVWSVNDVLNEQVQSSQVYATIDSTTGVLTGLVPGVVRVTATGNGVIGSIDITVLEPVDVVGELTGTPVLQGGEMVTLSKTKFNGLSGSNKFWATSGQELAESNPGTSATLASLKSIYTINISDNPFVPASVGQIISVVEVNSEDKIVGFGTFTVESETEIGTNKPPVAKMSEISISTGQDTWQYDLFSDPEGKQIILSNIVNSNTDVLTTNSYNNSDYLYIHGVASGTATLSFEVRDETGDKIEHTLDVIVGQPAPYLYFFYEDMPFINVPFSLIFEPNAEWFNAITSVEVNNVVIEPVNYKYTEEKEFSKYGETGIVGEILFDPSVLKEGENRIVIKAKGYAFATDTIYLHKSEESFYTSPLTINKMNGGITASFKSLNNDENEGYSEQATAIFQLMNGDVPVSTVSFTTDELESYQSFQAQFSLLDATTNKNYSVRAFLITGDNADNSVLGHNLSTEVSKEEFDILYQEWWND